MTFGEISPDVQRMANDLRVYIRERRYQISVLKDGIDKHTDSALEKTVVRKLISSMEADLEARKETLESIETNWLGGYKGE